MAKDDLLSIMIVMNWYGLCMEMDFVILITQRLVNIALEFENFLH
jgi:hypothetical protein